MNQFSNLRLTIDDFTAYPQVIVFTTCDSPSESKPEPQHNTRHIILSLADYHSSPKGPAQYWQNESWGSASGGGTAMKGPANLLAFLSPIPHIEVITIDASCISALRWRVLPLHPINPNQFKGSVSLEPQGSKMVVLIDN